RAGGAVGIGACQVTRIGGQDVGASGVDRVRHGLQERGACRVVKGGERHGGLAGLLGELAYVSSHQHASSMGSAAGVAAGPSSTRSSRWITEGPLSKPSTPVISRVWQPAIRCRWSDWYCTSPRARRRRPFAGKTSTMAERLK